jgi:hypothetical protein
MRDHRPLRIQNLPEPIMVLLADAVENLGGTRHCADSGLTRRERERLSVAGA